MYFPVLLWSLVIFASFWGYGEALRCALKRSEFDDLGWGLTAAWGMAVTLAIGGFLMMLSLAKAPVLTGVVLAGAALAAYHTLGKKLLSDPSDSKKGKKSKPADADKDSTSSTLGRKFQPSDWILWFMVCLAFLCSIAWPHQVDPNDDLICYLMLPERILQTGTLIEPFSLRRMGTLGGHSFLQALTMVVGNERSGHIADSGFGLLVWFGILWGMLSKASPGAWWLRFLILFVAVFLPVPRINTMSSLTGTALLAALFVTLDRWNNTKKTDWRSLLPIGLLVAAAASLRPIYLLPAAGVVGIFGTCMLLESLQKNPAPSACLSKSKVWFPFLLGTGLFTILFLASYMVVLWLSNGTIHYPPFKGFINPPFELVGTKEGAFVDGTNALAFLFSQEMLVIFFSFILAFAVASRSLALAIITGTFFCSWLIAQKFGVTVYSEIYRYTFPGAVAAGFFFLAKAASLRSDYEPSTLGLPSLISLPLLAIFLVNAPQAAREWGTRAKTLPEEIILPETILDRNLGFAYQILQDKVPARKSILAIVDAPYLLNYSRNPIYNVDAIGGASPWGGMPFFKGPETLKSYLLKNGVDYILTVDFDKALLLYTRKHWLEHQRPEWFFKEVWGKHALDFMDNIDKLADWGQVIGSEANVRLIKL
jgi:hypothetical protein